MTTSLTREQILNEFQLQSTVGATVEEAINELSRCSKFSPTEVRALLESEYGDLAEYQFKKAFPNNAPNL